MSVENPIDPPVDRFKFEDPRINNSPGSGYRRKRRVRIPEYNPNTPQVFKHVHTDEEAEVMKEVADTMKDVSVEKFLGPGTYNFSYDGERVIPEGQQMVRIWAKNNETMGKFIRAWYAREDEIKGNSSVPINTPGML